MTQPLENFEQIFATEYAAGYADEKSGTLLLVANNDYIPIKNFKQLFQMLGDEIEENGGTYTKLIFDKTALRTFHQPSMKWYFQEWKTEMLKHGLNKHVKILPKLGYFIKAVEAARKPLLAKYPQDILSQLSIDYAEDLEKAIAK